MAGHSKWKNIQHRKGAQDAKRGKVFNKISVEIMVAARTGGANPDDNPRLRQALAKAKAANMPKDNWQKAIKKGSGQLEGSNYVERNYEGYAPGGVAVFVSCLTDNATRTVSDVRHAFTKSGGSLGTDGSVAWMFERLGVLAYSSDKIKDTDAFMEAAIEAGAQDVRENEGFYELECESAQLLELKAALDPFCDDPDLCEVALVPQNTVELDNDKLPSLEKLINMLEDNDDVQNVYHNASGI